MRAAVLLVLLITLAGCRVGTTVDRDAPRFVDTAPAGSYVDSGSGSTIDSPAPPAAQDAPAIDADAADFTPPPGNYTENATIDLETKKGFVGKDVVKLWVWNAQGSRSIIAQEGSTLTVTGREIHIGAIGHEDGGRVQVSVDGTSRILRNRQETKVGDTWIFVSDVFLNAAQ